MNAEIRMGVFDIDGTMHLPTEGIPQEVNDGFARLRELEVLLTVSTGRGFSHLPKLLGEGLPQVSPGAPISVENGGRIIDVAGVNLRHHPLSREEIIASLEFAQRVGINYFLYFPRDTPNCPVIWSNRRDVRERLRTHYPHVDVNSAPLRKLETAILSDKPCMISLLPDDVLSGHEAPAGLNIVIGNRFLSIGPEGVDKATGLAHQCEIAGVEINHVLVAVNGSNDIALLEAMVGYRIIVGDDLVGPVGTVRVATPADLGRHLQQF